MNTYPLGKSVQHDFPFFELNPGITYLDSTATSLKPSVVIEAITDYYSRYSVNIHRGVYALSVEATEKFEAVRKAVLNFLQAPNEIEAIFTKGTTESINLLAVSLERVKKELAPFFSNWQSGLEKDDVILISESEHHSNLVPWQMLAERTGAKVVYIPVRADGSLQTEFISQNEFSHHKLKIVALSATSNVSGVVHDLNPFRELARKNGAIFMIDAAQAICHAETSWAEFSADFIAFSAHKMLGPTGLGILAGNRDVLSVMPPFHGGGDMIALVKKEGTTYNHPPHRFEAGTPPIAEAIGFGAALQYLNKIGMKNVEQWEHDLTAYALAQLEENGWHNYGPSSDDVISGRVRKAGAISFGIEGVHPHDIGTILDETGVAIRAGHHCCQLLMQSWGVPATARASLYIYNDRDDIDRLIDGLRMVKKIFKK